MKLDSCKNRQFSAVPIPRHV